MLQVNAILERGCGEDDLLKFQSQWGKNLVVVAADYKLIKCLYYAPA